MDDKFLYNSYVLDYQTETNKEFFQKLMKKYADDYMEFNEKFVVRFTTKKIITNLLMKQGMSIMK